jgi:hypothetical protein
MWRVGCSGKAWRRGKRCRGACRWADSQDSLIGVKVRSRGSLRRISRRPDGLRRLQYGFDLRIRHNPAPRLSLTIRREFDGISSTGKNSNWNSVFFAEKFSRQLLRQSWNLRFQISEILISRLSFASFFQEKA